MTAPLPYREPPPASPTPPSELFVPWGDTEQHGSAMRVFVGFSLGSGVAVIFSMVHPALGVLALLAVVAWAVAQVVRNRRSAGGVVLRVEQNVLLLRADPKAPSVQVPLDDLVNVEITTKAIQRVALEQQVGAPMMSTRVGPSVDVGRLTFILDQGGEDRPVHMTEAFESYSHCTEWLGRVRVFLRKHAWVPDDERLA